MYESFYRLTSKPFQLSPDPKFFFGSEGHKRALSYLRYGLTQGEGFIVITGGVGTGKTTLVRTLFSEIDKQNIVAAQLVNTHLEADDTLRMVAASFGLAHEGASKATILKNLETFLQARAREGKRVLLVVDEAQNLPVESLEELRMLSNFQISGRSLMQSFLLGQNEFKETIQSPGLEQLRQRIIAAFHLEPLSAEETKSYIEHRLKLVGWEKNPEITEAAQQVIFTATGGVPRRINTFCDRLLLFGYLEELTHIDEQHVKEVEEELKHESPMANRQVAEEEKIEPEELPEVPVTPIHIGLEQSRESEQIEGVEARLSILEDRIDILERALRRMLESGRR